MKKLKINKKFSTNIRNIKKFVISNEFVYVHLKSGYPKILKSRDNIDVIKNRLVNLGKNIHEFKVEKK